MLNKKKLLGNGLVLVLLLSCFQIGAHQPDLSSLMIYEQGGKTVLFIKSSLTAFQGEVEYLYGKDSYKTPEAFQGLVIEHFKKSCVVIINEDTVRFSNLQVALGHETTLFAELTDCPKTIQSFYLKNEMFKDMPSNLCEVILTLNDLPQKQVILGNDLNHEVTLNVKNGTWVVEAGISSFFKKSNTIFLGGLLLLVLLLLTAVILKKKQVR
jgi:hypothetical protein